MNISKKLSRFNFIPQEFWTNVNWTTLGILYTANIPVYLALGWFFFRTWDNFTECLGYLIKPDIWSWMNGEMVDDFWATMKIYLWLALCLGAAPAEYYVITNFMVFT